MQQALKRVLSVQDAAFRLGVHVTTIHRWSAAGTFVPKIRLGPGRVGFEAQELEEWLAGRRREAG